MFEIGRERVLWGCMGHTNKSGSSSSMKWDITKVFFFFFLIRHGFKTDLFFERNNPNNNRK